MIQIDEAGLREGLPLRQSEWKNYLDWAVDSFRLCSSGVRDKTQIHTHMKTRKWEEVTPALANMVAAAGELRASA
jgi:5-methyltetrahydropteroyltriglutamate--homocysteine methyltransferase